MELRISSIFSVLVLRVRVHGEGELSLVVGLLFSRAPIREMCPGFGGSKLLLVYLVMQLSWQIWRDCNADACHGE